MASAWSSRPSRRSETKNVLELWVRLLALQVTQPDTTCVAALVTRRAAGVRTWSFQSVPAEQAAVELNILVDLMLRGRCEPLPVMPATRP